MKYILLPIALILLYALSPIAFIVRMFYGGRADYCKRIAVSLDQLGNTICDKLFNATMGSEFGSEDETISSVLGRNKQEGKLKPIGKFVASLLNFIDKNHVEKAIEMKKLITLLIIFSALSASAQTTLTTAQLTARVIAADTAIARANRNISTLFSQNDSYKKQLTEAQSTIAKLVADTAAKSKLIASLQSKDTIQFSSAFLVTGNTVDLSADIKTSAAALLLQSNRISVLEEWRKQFANWIKSFIQ